MGLFSNIFKSSAAVDEFGVEYKNNILKKCSNADLSGEYNVAPGTEEIADGAFKNVNNLKSIKFPSSLKKIGHNAFKNCVSLEKVELPKSLREIGMEAFKGCTNLRTLIVDSEKCEANVSSFPPNLQTLVWKDSKLESKSFNNKKEKVIIKVPINNINSLKEELKSVGDVVGLNYHGKYPLGVDCKGNTITYVDVKIESLSNTDILQINDDARFCFTPQFAPLKVSVTDPSGKIVFESKEIVVDGDNRFDEDIFSENSMIIFNCKHLKVEEKDEVWDKLPSFIDQYIWQIWISQKVMYIFKSAVKPIPLIHKLSNKNDVVSIKFRIRVLDGVFDPEKLNFVSFRKDKCLTVDGINARKSYDDSRLWILNFLSYDGVFYEGDPGDETILSYDDPSIKQKSILRVMNTNETDSKLHFGILEYDLLDGTIYGWDIGEEDGSYAKEGKPEDDEDEFEALRKRMLAGMKLEYEELEEEEDEEELEEDEEELEEDEEDEEDDD